MENVAARQGFVLRKKVLNLTANISKATIPYCPYLLSIL